MLQSYTIIHLCAVLLSLCVLFIFVSRLFRKLKAAEEKHMSDNKAPQIKYEVFISFRGEIRRRFLSHLVDAFKRNHINPFVDNILRRGHEISSSLVEAIEGSFILLIIFSPDYASSHWCLNELVKIHECKEKYGRIVIPVFYDVEPTHVRHQSHTYKKSFDKHVKKYQTTKVKSWRDALKKSANISGFEASKFQDDKEMIDGIVNHINLELKKLAESLVNSEGLIAINEKVATVESLIRKEPKKTRVIGIWGMGGIGKTTLAKEVFNKLQYGYNGSYFLADEREQSEKHGILDLKKIIFSKLLGCPDVKTEASDSVPVHIVMKTRRMKVLIVLDDVDDPEHLEQLLGTLTNFAPGSRIIITTRYEQVLKTSNANETYNLTELSSDKALELFNLKAFDQRDDQWEYNDLSKRVIHYAKGIPLVLKVLASDLRRNTKEVWEGELDKLEKKPPKKVYDVMIRSYSNLEPKQKEIFLDLACFFLGSRHTIEVSDLKFLLKDGESGNSVVSDLERLKQKALITFSEDNCVYMHDVLQEMALEIVRGESIKDPGSRSRLWDPADICELKTGKVSEDMRSIQIDFSEFKDLKSIPVDIFSKMSRLQFLGILGICNSDLIDPYYILAEGLRYLPSELRFLFWESYPLKSLPENFSVERLVILSLNSGEIEELWDGVKNLVNLKVLDLSRSWELKELPDLLEAPNLQVLNVIECRSLTSIHPSIFFLPKLERLAFQWSGVNVLPSFALQSKVKSLRLHGTKIETLPSSFKNFTLVLKLDVRYCFKLQTILELPPLLETLNASFCRSLHTIRKLPHSLKTLNVNSCTSLQTLPELPPSLKTLDAMECKSLWTLPKLPHVLEFLNVSLCHSLQTLPMLPMSLKTLYSRVCSSLKIRFLFSDLRSLDEPSLVAIGLNAQTNMMKIANQHISTTNHNHVENYSDYDDNYDSYQAVYVYPGSSVPEWLEYKTTNKYIIIDLSSAPPCTLFGFLFCFVLGDYATADDCNVVRFEVNITISDDEDEIENDSVKIFGHDFCCADDSDNVHVIYDQRCSDFLNSKAKNQKRFKIKVILEALCYDGDKTFHELLPQHALKGLGISPISNLAYESFFQQIVLRDSSIISGNQSDDSNNWSNR